MSVRDIIQAASGGSDTVAWNLEYAYYGPEVPWYLSSTSTERVASKNILTEDTSSTDLFFKPDGTKMYVLGTTNDSVYEYTLSTAWKVDTASYVQSFSVTTEDTNPQGLFFKSDGTKMYIAGITNDTVYEYDLSTAWDISTASYLQSFSVASQDTQPNAVSFKTDGTKMYIAGGANDRVYEYDLSTAWDVTTASFLQFKSVSALDTAVQGLHFSNDGLNMFICGTSSDNAHRLELSTAWDISTATNTSSASIILYADNPQGIFVKPDGSMLYAVSATDDTVSQWFLGIADIGSREADPEGVFFSPDGLRMYITGIAGDDVTQYSLSTAWDLNTATYVRDRALGTTNKYDLFFKDDGTKMFITAGTNVLEYSLSTAWDVSTTSLVQTFTKTGNAFGLFFKPDGTKMYVSNTASTIEEYDLSTAWDIGTASLLYTMSVTHESFSFKSDGTKLFVLTSATDEVIEFDLTVAWKITSAVEAKRFSIDDANPTGLFFKPNGTGFFVIGATRDWVYPYKIGIQE